MNMKYAKLGKTDIEVSRICVGCMSYGKAFDDFQPWTLPLEESTKMISHALDLGVNFFDTANCYSHGTSEEYLGAALKSLGVARDKVVLASKVYFNDGHLSKDAIAREIEGTLKRLGTDYLDLYQIHRFDYSTPIEETMAALDALVKSGKVRAIGASAMYGYQFHNMQIAAERNGLALFSTLQNHYNLLYREDERDLIPVARQYGVSMIPYSPLAGGHLTHPEWDSPSKRAQTDKVLHAKSDRQGPPRQVRCDKRERHGDCKARGGACVASWGHDVRSRACLAFCERRDGSDSRRDKRCALRQCRSLGGSDPFGRRRQVHRRGLPRPRGQRRSASCN